MNSIVNNCWEFKTKGAAPQTIAKEIFVLEKEFEFGIEGC